MSGESGKRSSPGEGLFSVNGRMQAAMSLFADVVTVNFLVLIGSIPLVTAGASLTAGYSVILHRLRGDRGAITPIYLRGFRAVFRTVTPLWCVFLAVVVLALYELALLDAAPYGAVATVLRALIVAGLVIVAMIGAWMIPVAAVGATGVRGTLTIAVSLAFRQLPRTLVLLLILLSPWALAAVSPLWAARVLMALLIFGTGLLVYLAALVVDGPVHRFLGHPAGEYGE